MHTRIANGRICLFKNILIQLVLLCTLFCGVSKSAFAYAYMIDYMTADTPNIHLGYWFYFDTKEEAYHPCLDWVAEHTNNTPDIQAKCGDGVNTFPAGSVGYYRINRKFPFRVAHFYINVTCPDSSKASIEFGCEKKPEDTGNQCEIPSTGNPISTAYGNKFQTEVDYSGNGAFPLIFSRYYNSRSQSTDSTIGRNWSFSFQKNIETISFTVDGRTNLIGFNLARQDGRNIKFKKEAGQSTDYPVVLSDEIIIIEGDKTLRTATYKNGTVETYEMSLDAATNTMSVGRLVSIRNIQGFTQTLTYNTQDQLESVADDNGNSLSFTYNAEGKMETMTDPDLNVYTYVYQGDLLESVIYPDSTPGDTSDNPSKTYHYEDTRFPTALTGITNENNVRYATWEYDDSGRAYVSKHAGESGIDETSITFNEDGSRTVTNPLGKQTTYHFINVNDNMRVDRVEGHPSPSCGGTNRGYTYDANGFIETKTDWNGNITSYVRDNMGRIDEKTVAAGTADAKTTAYTYHPTLKLKTQIDKHQGEGTTTPIIKSTSIVYYGDEAGEEYWSGLVKSRTVTDTITDESRTTSYTYYGEAGDENGNGARQLKTVDGPRTDVQDITTYTYDAKGNLKTTQNALGHISEIVDYDGAGRPLTIRDQNQVETVLTYTPRGWLETSTRQNHTTEYFYDAVGNVTDIISPDGSTITYDYDDANRLTDIFDKHGNNIHYDLNDMGGITGQQIKDPQGTLHMVRTTLRDELNRIKHSIGANVAEDTETNYDDNGNPDTITDPLDRVTDHEYDGLNQLTQTIYKDNDQSVIGTVTMTYDDYGNIETVTDLNQKVTTYIYNALGDLKTIVSPDNGTTQILYDSAGNVKTVTDERGVEVIYSYDALNRRTFADYPGTDEDITYGYDNPDADRYGIGQLTSITEANTEINYYYQATGHIRSITQSVDNFQYRTDYKYDNAGRVSQIEYPSGLMVNYHRNTIGNVERISVVETNGIELNLLNNITTLPFGPVTGWESYDGSTTSREYDLDYRLDLSTVNVGGTMLIDRDHAYTNHGLLNDYSDSVGPQSFSFTYDNLNRMDTVDTPFADFDFGFGPNANLNTETKDGTLITYTHDTGSNRLTGITSGGTTESVTINSAGYLTDIGNKHIDYDQRGRIKTITEGTTTLGTYTHNALGIRVKKIANNLVTHYVHNLDGQLLSEINGNGQIISEIVYLNGEPIARAIKATEPPIRLLDGFDEANSMQSTTGHLLMQNNSSASKDAGEPDHAGNSGGHSVWVSYFAYTTGTLTINTCDSDFDTLLAVYQGESVSTLSEITSNDDSAECANGTGSQVSFTVMAGQSYMIAIDGKNGATGNIDLRWNYAGQATSEEIPTLAEWGMIVMMVAMACIGVYTSRKHPNTIVRMVVIMGSTMIIYAAIPANTSDASYTPPTPTPIQWEFIHNDYLGNPILLTDESGQKVWQAQYSPYGEVNETVYTQTTDFNLRGVGRYADRETNFIYNHHRYIIPEGRIFNKYDPIGLNGGLNPFGYVGGDGVNYADPKGLRGLTSQSLGQSLTNSWGFSSSYSTSRNKAFRSANKALNRHMQRMFTTAGVLVYMHVSNLNPFLWCEGAEDDAEASRCRKVKNQCIESCSQFGLPSKYGDGTSFRRCVRNCMERQGCFNF